MTRSWIYAICVFALYILLVAGVPLFPGLLATVLVGQFTLGMLLFLLLHTLPLLLALLYLRSRAVEDAATKTSTESSR